MQTLRSIRRIVNRQTVVVALFAVASTWLCSRLGLTAEFPLTLIGIAIVFPLVFSIGGAYKRREAALDEYGSIKAHGRALFFAARDWIPQKDPQTQRGMLDLLGELMDACRSLFTSPVAEMRSREERVYRAFSDLSMFIQTLRDRGLPSGEASRCNQFLSKMLIAFENVKHIYQYRTPQTLRAYSQFFIYLLPTLYGPYFAGIAAEAPAGLGYFMPVLFAVVLVCLDNIQEQLEDPFDQVGEDDVVINAEKFVARLEAVASQPQSARAETAADRRILV